MLLMLKSFLQQRQHSILHPEQIVGNPSLIRIMEGLPVDPPENGGDCSYRRLHCEDGAEPGPALRNAFVGLGGLRQWVSLDDGFDFPLRDEIKSFEIANRTPGAEIDGESSTNRKASGFQGVD
jgi:hypothetical protein